MKVSLGTEHQLIKKFYEDIYRDYLKMIVKTLDDDLQEYKKQLGFIVSVSAAFVCLCWFFAWLVVR